MRKLIKFDLRICLLGVALCGFAPPANSSAPTVPTSHYERGPVKDRVIVFVHGIFGDANSTWTSPGGNYWPKLILSDSAFDGFDVYVANYESPVRGNTMTVDEVVTSLNSILTSDGIFEKHREVVFVCHSLGGIVIQQSLITFREHANKVPYIYFFSVPEEGSQIATLGKLFSSDPLLEALFHGNENGYLLTLENQWKAAHFKIHRYCAYEKKTLKGFLVVDRLSATRNCDDPAIPINEDHLGIVKPDNARHASYIAFRNAVVANLKTSAVDSRQNNQNQTPRATRTSGKAAAVPSQVSAPVPPPMPGMFRCGDGTFVVKPEDCGVLPIANNINRDGETPNLSNTHRALVDNNLVSGSQRQTLTIRGEDTTVTHNTFVGTNVEVAKEARRTFITDNLFRSEVLVARISDARGSAGDRDSLLDQIRKSFEEGWQKLPADQYQSNEQLLQQFESSARDSAFDAITVKTSLQKVIDATSKPVSDLSAPPPGSTTLKFVNNFMEAGTSGTGGNGVEQECADDKLPGGEQCGRWNSEIRLNTFFIRGGGTHSVLPPNSHQAFVEDNTYISAPSSGKTLVELNGSDTAFRKNRVIGADFGVAVEAQRSSIHDNIFKAEPLVKQIGESDERLETVLADIRLAFEEQWGSLAEGTRIDNEKLLSKFEESAREKPLDTTKTQGLLQKVIDATPEIDTNGVEANHK
jgi:hypothetical protein